MNDNELRYEDLPKILPAYENGVFQSMLTLPEAKKALVSAVSAFLDRPVKTVTLRSNTDPSRDKNEKLPRYDINCVVNGKAGDQCEIEMQANPMFGDKLENEHENIRWRSVYYLSRLHAGQYGTGKPYAEFVRSYQIMLCTYKVFKREQALVERFTFRNSSGDELSDAVTSIFIDLSKAAEIAKKPVSEMTEVEMWTTFIALADDSRYGKVIGEIAKRMEGIAVADVTLKSISQNPEERYRYYNRAKTLQDEEHKKAVMKIAKDAEKKALDAAKKAEADAIKAEAKASKAEAKANKAEAKVSKANAEVSKARAEAESLRAELADKDATIDELRARLAAAGVGEEQS